MEIGDIDLSLSLSFKWYDDHKDLSVSSQLKKRPSTTHLVRHHHDTNDHDDRVFKVTETVHLSPGNRFSQGSSTHLRHRHGNNDHDEQVFKVAEKVHLSSDERCRGIKRSKPEPNNRDSIVIVEIDDDQKVSSPNSTVSIVSGKREISDDDDGEGGGGGGESGGGERKKLRLTKEQSAVLEGTFEEHTTLNTPSSAPSSPAIAPLNIIIIFSISSPHIHHHRLHHYHDTNKTKDSSSNSRRGESTPAARVGDIKGSVRVIVCIRKSNAFEKQKVALAKQLSLRPRQVEVWFQNRRARTKLKQTEVDCEYLKRGVEKLTEENRRLQKEVQELRALKLSHPHINPPTALTVCGSCDQQMAGLSASPSNVLVKAPVGGFRQLVPVKQQRVSATVHNENLLTL